MSLLRYRNLLRHLVLKDIKLKYRNSSLGFLWSLANPILMIMVYTFAFKFIMKSSVHNFTLFLLAGMLPWNFFAASAQGSTSAVLDNAALIRKQVFPLEVLPVSTVLFNLFLFLMALLVLLPVGFLVFGLAPSWSLAAFPAVLILQVLFTVGVSLFLSTATAFFRDVRHLTEVVLLMLFWLTPVVYDFKSIPKPYDTLVFYLNPMTAFTLGYQDALFRQSWPSSRVMLTAAGYAGLALLVGCANFWKYKSDFAEIV